MSNHDTFAETYSQAFVDSYPHLSADRCKDLIAKAVKVALDNIGHVNIDGPAFKLTAKRLGIKHTKKAFKEYLGQEG